MWYFAADLHLDHGNIIKYCGRPFMNDVEQELYDMIKRGTIPQSDLRISRESVKLMTDTIIDNTNAVVRETDHYVIAGDVCWSNREDRVHKTMALLNRFRCRNIYIVIGNHDDRQTLVTLKNTGSLRAVYDKYMFNVDGQNIAVDHYPNRSWDRASHGAWMLYGHVHNNLTVEDQGGFLPFHEKVLRGEFTQILDNWRQNIATHESQWSKSELDQMVEELIQGASLIKGNDFTQDIGVDNVRKGVPFGTPWSMDDLKVEMSNRKARRDKLAAKYGNMERLH